jgi:hypothetical protein
VFSFASVVDEVALHLRDVPDGVRSQAIQAARTLLEAAATDPQS